jgi:putative ABC transport system permease protein
VEVAAMSYALKTLVYERQRFLPAILAVAFSALLIALQCGLLLGLFAITSIPIDRTRAHIWVAAPKVLSVDLGRPLPEGHLTRLACQPEVDRPEVFLQGFSYWAKPGGGSELCIVIGSELRDGALGTVRELTPELRDRLTEPDAIVVDETELDRLGIPGVGAAAEISGCHVRVVGLVNGLKSLSGPYIFCSRTTAQRLLHLAPEQTTYLLARCHNPADAPTVVERLRTYDDISAFTSEEFSLRSRLHWLTKTKAGIAMGCAAALGLLVGAVVTSQTLYAATAASAREYAVLRALGIPRWRMAGTVLVQSFWVGLTGLALAVPAVFGLAATAATVYVPVQLPPLLLGGTAVLTMAMALLSGLAALRSLRLVDPIVLLR